MNKNSKLIKFFRFAITFSLFILAVFLGLKLWHNYMNTPWTRDGRIRADTIIISPDVSGLVEKVYVKDNQFVKKGDLLFQIDKKRFIEDITKLEALCKVQKVEYEMLKKQFDRRFMVNNDVKQLKNMAENIQRKEIEKNNV